MPKLFKTTEGGQNGDINWMSGRSQSDIRYVITMDTTEDEDVTIIAGKCDFVPVKMTLSHIAVVWHWQH